MSPGGLLKSFAFSEDMRASLSLTRDQGLQIFPGPSIYLVAKSCRNGSGAIPVAIARQQKVWLSLLLRDVQFGCYTIRRVGMFSAEYSDDIYLLDSEPRLCLPVAGQLLLDRPIREFEGCVRMLCLADEEHLEILVVVIIE